MKPHLKFPCTILATALAAALQLAAIAAVPVAWTNSPGMPPYPIKPVPHGSTVDLAVTLKGYTTPPIADGADVRLWYQTNGMGSAWWSAPATFDGSTITASFGPAQDCGADRVSLFFGAPSNVFASAVLRLTHAPGFAPASLPPPPGVAMQPWVAEQLAALAMATTNYTNQTLADFASTGKVAYAAASSDAEVANRLIDSNGQNYTADDFATKVKTTSCAWSAYCDTMFSHPFALSQVSPTTWRFFPVGGRRLGAPTITLNRVGGQGNDGFWELSYGAATSSEYIPGTNSAPASAMQLEFAIVGLEPSGGAWTNSWTVSRTNNVSTSVAYLDDVPTNLSQLENDVPYATRGDVSSAIPPAISKVVTKSYVENLGITSEEEDPVWAAEKPNYATKTELGGVSETANAAALDAASALRIVLGESVWFAVTNYMRTAEGVIPSLQLWEVRDSVTNLVYDSREEITNTVKALTRELHTELTNRIHDAEKTIPSKAWGNYQSDGTDNPEPGKVAIVNQPTVILTGGGTFNKYVEIGDSSIWVLTSSGPVSFGGGGANGNYFAVLDDEGNAHFKVSKTDSFDVEAIFTDNPRTSGDALLLYICSTNRQGEAYIGPPTLSACTNLQEAVWHDEADGEIDALGTSVAWARNDAIHAWVGTVTQDRWAMAMFFRAKMKQEGGTAIINTAPVRFDGGIQIGNGKYRLVPYTTGGKTYLTVEGLQ